MKRADLGALLLLSALWGGSFIFIRIIAPVMGPVLLVELRVLLAGLALLAFAATTKGVPHLRDRWRQYLTVGALNTAIPFLLISTAELRLTASLAAILNATTPLFGALIAAAWIGESLSVRKAIGLALGFLGVGVLVGWSPIPLTNAVLLSVGASLLAAAFYGLGGVYTKARLNSVQPLTIAIGSQLGASAVVLPVVPFFPPGEWPSTVVVISLLALALLSTALGYLLYYRLIVNVGATKTMTVTFLAPIFGVTWGALLLREPVGMETLVGCGIILGGTALVTGLRLSSLGIVARRGRR